MDDEDFEDYEMSDADWQEMMDFIDQVCSSDPEACEGMRRRMAIYEDVHFPATPFHPSVDVIEPVGPHPGWLSPPWQAPRPQVVETFRPPVVTAPYVTAPVRHW